MKPFDMKRKELYTTAILLCLTLGLAPFVPEPHIWGKLKWVAGGGVGMGVMDWLDLLMHGAPFLLLIGLVVRDVVLKLKPPKAEKTV